MVQTHPRPGDDAMRCPHSSSEMEQKDHVLPPSIFCPIQFRNSLVEANSHRREQSTLLDLPVQMLIHPETPLKTYSEVKFDLVIPWPVKRHVKVTITPLLMGNEDLGSESFRKSTKDVNR